MPTAFSYIRFSSAQQQHGASLERQESMVSRWLLQHPDYTRSTDRFADLGISGFKGKHLDNAFGRLLAAVESGVIKNGDCILIEAIDRAGRLEPMAMLPLLSQIVNAGIDIFTLDDGIKYDKASVNSNHLFLLVAKVQQAYQYSDTLSRRVKDAYTRKRDKAAAGGGVTRRTPLWLDRDGKLIEDLAPVIASIFEDYASGIGERRILARVRGQHPLLEDLNPTTIKKWLRNPTAVGRWNDLEDVYPAAVSKELWFRVQKRLKDGKKIKSASSVYLLSGLVRCGRCGKNFGVVNTKRSPPVMLCMGRHRLGAAGCSNSRSIPYGVLMRVCSFTSQWALQRAASGQALTRGEKRLIEIDGQLSDLHRQSENVIELLAEHGKTMPGISAKLARLSASVEALETEQALLKAAPAVMDFDHVIDLEYDLLQDDPQRFNAMLQAAGYAIVCDGTTITVDEPSLQNDLARQVFEYKGADRATETYRLVANGTELYTFEMNTPDQLAANAVARDQFVAEEDRDKAERAALRVAGKLIVTVQDYSHRTEHGEPATYQYTDVSHMFGTSTPEDLHAKSVMEAAKRSVEQVMIRSISKTK